MNIDVDVPEPEDDHTHALEVEEGDCQRTNPDHTPLGRKRGRRAPTYYDFGLTVEVRCTGCGWKTEVTLAGDVQASAMEQIS